MLMDDKRVICINFELEGNPPIPNGIVTSFSSMEINIEMLPGHNI